MPEFFITARSFAAPFFSDSSETYVEAETPEAALEQFAAGYSHPFGLYAAEAWENADHFHKAGKLAQAGDRGGDPLARWLSNHELALQEATGGRRGGYSYFGHGPGDFEVSVGGGERKRITVTDPTGGRVLAGV